MSDLTPRKAAIPLASLTALGLLASDLYLPALPSMGKALAASVPAAQATMAVFMVALALSQLAWGWAADQFGDRRTIMLGTLLLGGGSLWCALAPDIGHMLAGRLLQGLGTGAANVAVPALIRRRFNPTDSVKALAVVAMAESTIPAAGPIIGAAIVLYADWRTTFWIICALSLLLLPLVSAIVGPTPPRASAPPATFNYLPLLRNRSYMRYASSYALMFGALLMYVASAPYVITVSMGLDIRAFAALQVAGVLAFMAGGTLAYHLVKARGPHALMLAGCVLQFLAAAGMLAIGMMDAFGLPVLMVLAALFCSGLGLRGPSTMAGALQAAGEEAGKGAGLLMFLSFAAVAGATQAVAPLLAPYGFLAVAGMLFALVMASLLVLPDTLRARAG